MPYIDLFPFRYRNPVTGNSIRAWCVATREEIAKDSLMRRCSALPDHREQQLMRP
jgi:hypothetical protein